MTYRQNNVMWALKQLPSIYLLKNACCLDMMVEGRKGVYLSFCVLCVQDENYSSLTGVRRTLLEPPSESRPSRPHGGGAGLLLEMFVLLTWREGFVPSNRELDSQETSSLERVLCAPPPS